MKSSARPSRFDQTVETLKNQSRYRSLSLPNGIDLTSNDYLGFREHPTLKQAALEAIESGMPLGSGGSRLLRGHTEAHESLEHHAASFFKTNKALYFATGYQANLALFTALPSRQDVIVFDSLIHASARDGIQASRPKHIRVPHNDLNAYEDALKQASQSAEIIWIAVESLYSMDGDFAPLSALYDLSLQYNAMLIVDEAHATGVFGPAGRGMVHTLPFDTKHPENIITLHTCGKALGVAGGLVCASADIIETLINKARPFIYSTAPPPLQAHLVHKALELSTSPTGDEQRQKLFELIEFIRSDAFLNGQFAAHKSQIVPIIIGQDKKSLDTATALQADGYDIRAVRPPSVPEGTARLRLSLSAILTTEVLNRFSDDFRNRL